MKSLRSVVLFPLLASLLCIAGAAAQPAVVPSPGADAIRALCARPWPALVSPAHPWNGRDWLDRFYAPRGYAAAWSRGQAREALALLDAAAAQGLDPADYGLDALRAQPGPGADAQRFDVALSAAFLHYLADIRLGRVRSEFHHGGEPDQRSASFDPVELLRVALDSGRLADAVAAAQPAVPLYAHTMRLLARYRELAQEPQAVLPTPRGKLGPGAHYAQAAELHARLVQLGDLDAGIAAPQGQALDEALAQGIKAFQSRHGLAENGLLDRDTVAALNVPLRERVRQLELTLERLRWLPDFAPGPLVAVNLPTYRLWAFDTTRPGEPVLEMKVIVGAAIKTPTPLFVGQMRYLDFNPYWNVPRSITLKEIIPKLERNHGYLAASGMEVVGQGGATSTAGESTIEALRAGKLRVRQRPGPRNSLGAVKFAMPNPMDIYLHATPLRELFRRTRRDLSHGCIRVEQPAELAQFVLRDQPQWDREAIAAAMAPGPTRRVELSAPVPVVIFYATALGARDGRALFGRDIYHRDPLLEQALREHSDGVGAK
jgi:murein L,D-transpeptidase YcbB/YkuD